ncbi:hypothetical protein SDC9_61763 [bioreactor metagenome]|uniref:Uncharacterized protein n=1 Tax=bioreactor metagenome TaxID=1076179 RepID=A0A644XMA4_9ZZZZ
MVLSSAVMVSGAGAICTVTVVSNVLALLLSTARTRMVYVPAGKVAGAESVAVCVSKVRSGEELWLAM